MIPKKNLFLICVYYLTISASEGWRPFKIEITSISTYSSVDYVEANSSISGRGSLSVFVNVLRNMPNLYAKVIAILESSNGIYDLELINKTIDACELFRNPKYEPIAQILYRALTKGGSFPKRCPIQKKLYFLKDMTIDPEHFPPVMPSKGCITDVTLMAKNGNSFKITGGYKMHAEIKQVKVN